MTNESIIFEQPLNEQIRFCLRLEYLFEQANYFLDYRSLLDLRQVLSAILEILLISDRPDLKTKLGQTLNQYMFSLGQLEKSPDIDKQKLHNMLKQIGKLVDDLHSNTQKIGQELREDGFLMAIQQRLYIPGGTCNFSLPAYHLWLEQDKNKLRQRLIGWLDSFKQLQEITSLMLKIVRESVPFKLVKAIGGFFQIGLEPQINYQMIRILLPSKVRLFPEISVGRHRLTIHLFSLDINGKVTQTLDDCNVELSCCKF